MNFKFNHILFFDTEIREIKVLRLEHVHVHVHMHT